MYDLPADLQRIQQDNPMQADESRLTYARRLREASQSGEPSARVAVDRALSDHELALLSGLPVYEIARSTTTHALPESLRIVRSTWPRERSESRVHYARRLQAISRAGESRDGFECPPLSVEDLAQLAAINPRSLRTNPRFSPVEPELLAIRQRFPRQPKERGIFYARRLHAASHEGIEGTRIDGRALSLEEIARIAEVKHYHVKTDRFMLSAPPPLRAIRQEFPPNPHGENGVQYAVRLLQASADNLPGARRDPAQPLTLEELSALTGLSLRKLATQVLPALPAPSADPARAMPIPQEMWAQAPRSSPAPMTQPPPEGVPADFWLLDSPVRD